MISRFEYCVSCIFHLHSCKKFSHILISLCKVVFLLFQFSVHLCIFARGCICTVWIFCVFVYFCARVTETSRRQTGRDVEVKRARDIFTSARSWLPTALQDLPYKDNQDEENESCKDKWSLNTSSINERIACDPNTFDLDFCVQVHQKREILRAHEWPESSRYSRLARDCDSATTVTF